LFELEQGSKPPRPKLNLLIRERIRTCSSIFSTSNNHASRHLNFSTSNTPWTKFFEYLVIYDIEKMTCKSSERLSSHREKKKTKYNTSDS